MRQALHLITHRVSRIPWPSPQNPEARPAVPDAAGRRAAGRADRLRDLGRSGFCHDNAMLIFTGLSPSAHAASSTEDPSPGWWEDMIGPGRPIDTRRFFVICVNSLGSPFGSTSPASINPATGQPYRLTFPVLTVEDIARAGHEVAVVARHQAARVRRRPVARRHDRARVLRAVSERSAQRSFRSPRPRARRRSRSRCARCSGK